MVYYESNHTATKTKAEPEPTQASDPLALYDNNGNGRMTCAETRSHRIVPVHASHPAYKYMHDRDGDGVVCN